QDHGITGPPIREALESQGSRFAHPRFAQPSTRHLSPTTRAAHRRRPPCTPLGDPAAGHGVQRLLTGGSAGAYAVPLGWNGWGGGVVAPGGGGNRGGALLPTRK